MMSLTMAMTTMAMNKLPMAMKVMGVTIATILDMVTVERVGMAMKQFTAIQGVEIMDTATIMAMI